MAEVSIPMVHAFDELQQRYSLALDEGNMSAWLATFSERESASYICISTENDKLGMRIALMLDDCRARLMDRVTFVTKVWAGTFQPYNTRHFVQRISSEKIDEATLHVQSNFSIVITPDGGPSTVLAAGRYVDTVEMIDGEARFLSRRAVYDTTVLPRYVVYPL